MKKDVIVIGAGPAGAKVAAEIAKSGFDVLILEKAQSPGKSKVCGGTLSKNEFLPLNLPKSVIENEVHKIVVHLNNECLELPSKRGFVLFNRDIFDSEFVRLAQNAGAEIVTSTMATDVAVRDKEAFIRYKQSPSKESKEIRAKIVVFADGANTLAQKTLGIGFKKNPNSTVLAGVYEIKNQGNVIDCLEFFVSREFSPAGYGWVFPKKDTINLGVTCVLSKLTCNIRQNLDRLLAFQNLQSNELISYGFRIIPQSTAKKIYYKSALVVGDAAGTADPITGDGISNAIANGKIASKTVIKVLESDDFTKDAFATYDQSWKDTENYKRIVSKYQLQKMALKMGINPAISVGFGAFTGSTH